ITGSTALTAHLHHFSSVERFQLDHRDRSAGFRLECARRRGLRDDGGEDVVTLRAVEDSRPGLKGFDADLGCQLRVSLRGAEPHWMSRGATVRGDDEVTVATSVVGKRRRARLAALRVDCREQEETHVREVAAYDAAVRAELLDHGLVEALR